MKKLKLDVEGLTVDSFLTAEGARDAGTVEAYDAPTYPAPSCGCTTGASYLVTIEATARTSSTLTAPGLRPTLRSEVAGSAVTIKADSWMAYRRVA